MKPEVICSFCREGPAIAYVGDGLAVCNSCSYKMLHLNEALREAAKVNTNRIGGIKHADS